MQPITVNLKTFPATLLSDLLAVPEEATGLTLRAPRTNRGMVVVENLRWLQPGATVTIPREEVAVHTIRAESDGDAVQVIYEE
jgi:hypothetical protein